MKKENRRVLIIDDERPNLLTLEALLGGHGYVTETAATARAGLRALKSNPPALVLLGLQLPGAEGFQMLEQIKSEHPETQVIILAAHDSLSNAIESTRRGAFHFISKPYAPEELLSLVEKALEKQTLLRETEELREKTKQLEKRLEIAETRSTPILPVALQQSEPAGDARQGVQTLDDVERKTILQALAQTHGNKKKAAQLLGIQRPTLYNKMKRFAIDLQNPLS